MSQQRTPSAKRRLFADEDIVVVFDTSPLRNLAYGAIPDWVSVFSQMAEDRYRFLISDVAFAELTVQVSTGRIPLDGYIRMIDAIRTFVHEDLPVLPGKIDLEAIIGLHDDPGFLDQTQELSLEAWRRLQNRHVDHKDAGLSLEDIITAERDDWVVSIENAASFAAVLGIDLATCDPNATSEMLAGFVEQALERATENDVIPSVASRSHLGIRHRVRQMIRSKQQKDPYNPRAPKSRNDGIDIDLFGCLILPALVVADDGGFFRSLDGIASFQREWFFKPDGLAECWLAGQRPEPKWPEDE